MVFLAFFSQKSTEKEIRVRMRRKVASDLRFLVAISDPKTPFLCGISGDLALSTRKSALRTLTLQSLLFSISLLFSLFRFFLAFFVRCSFSNQESPRQTKPKKGPKRKVHEFRPFLCILVFFFGKTSTIHIEILFRNAPGKSS